MVFKLYGSYASPYVRLVAAVLLDKQVPFELVPVDLANGEHKSPEYLSKHPFGQIPCIVCYLLILFESATVIHSTCLFSLFVWLGQDDDGFILYESKAISYYIASKYPNQGTPLLPTGLEATALFQQAVAVEASHFNDHATKALGEIIYKK